VTPRFFKTPGDLRAWFSDHGSTTRELLVGFYKKDSGKPSVTYHEALDEALAVGWIDGVRRSRSADSYTIRFTPRTPKSYWSLVNTKRAKDLIAGGRMTKAGLAACALRDEAKTKKYSYEREQAAFGPGELRALRAEKAAWKFFEAQPPGYRKLIAFFVMSARKEETRARRLAMLLQHCREGRRIDLGSRQVSSPPQRTPRTQR